jgi:hypothetical protein
MARHPFHQFRTARKLSFGVLVWLVLSLVAAVISPAMAQADTSWPIGQICSADGGTHVAPADSESGGTAQATGGWHCVLCFTGAAPAALTQVTTSLEKPREVFQLASFNAPHLERWAGPPPGRGPPTSL